MRLRRLSIALSLVSGLCVWGIAHSSDAPAPSAEAASADRPGSEDGTRTEAAARYRANQSTHWRHVVVGNNSCSR